MIARISKAMSEKEKGFTLIELLVVVVIIGILAAIAIPQFLKYREGAWQKAVESDTHNLVLAVEAYTVDNNGALPTTAGPFTGGDAKPTDGPDFAASKDNTLTYSLTDGVYTITGKNTNLGEKTYTYTSSNGTGAWSE